MAKASDLKVYKVKTPEKGDLVFGTCRKTGKNVNFLIESICGICKGKPKDALQAVAVNDEFSVNMNEVLTGNVSHNDQLGDGENKFTKAFETSNGNLDLSNDGSFTYKPNLNYFGRDQFAYSISNSDGTNSQGVVHIEVIDTVVEPPVEYYSFQFNNLNKGIDNLSEVNDSFLSNYGTLHSERSVYDGKKFVFKNVGRYGFVIKNISRGDEPIIFDFLNNDVTDILFHKQYDEVTKTMYFLSKEYVAPSTIFYKID